MFIKNKIVGSAILLGMCSAALFAVETPSEPVKADNLMPNVRNEVNRYTVGYLKKENEASEIVKQANELFKQEDYFKARDLYIDAKKRLTKLNPEYFRDNIQFCDTQIKLCYYEIANMALAKADASAAVNDYDEAIRLCNAAAEVYPECSEIMRKKVEYYTNVRKTLALQQATSTDAVVPDKEALEYEISILVRRARAYVNAGLYEKAKRIYEQILVKDPFRADILQDLTAVNAYIRKAGQRRTLTDRRRSIVANELEWALPLQGVTRKTTETLDAPVEKVVVQESPTAKKLREIVIDSIEFNDVKLRTILTTLVDLSRRNSSNNSNTGGVNIILRQRPVESTEKQDETAAAPAAPAVENNENNNADNDDDDDEDDYEEENIAPGEDESTWTELEKTPLTLPRMEKKTLEEVIRNICINAKLRYRVEENAVIIEELDMPETDMISRIIPIDPTGLSDCDPNNPEELKNYFSSQGIAFPVGSSIIFDSKISRIFATNTPANLEKIEQVCNATSGIGEGGNGDTLVQIQLRIIEVDQSDLNALGFNYTLSDNSPKNPVFTSMNTENQLRTGVEVGPTASANFNMGEFSLNVDIKALDNISSKDVLASPRVTTLPDERVDIKLVTQTYFVEDFDEAETEKTTAENGEINYTYVGPFPNFESEPQELGIKFGTTPRVDYKNRLITMELKPELSALVGWTTYTGTNDDGDEETIRTPIIAKRTISTNVTIRDGQTLVLGGVIEDNVSMRKDKVPLLGDIPLLGRLFQSRNRLSNKKNLLIFVTPRLVKTDGTLKYPGNHTDNRGLPQFL